MATVPPGPARSQLAIWLSIVLGVALVCAVAFAAVEVRRAQNPAVTSRQWQPFIEAAKTFAHDRYTSTPQTMDADLQRFIDETTGELHERLLSDIDKLKTALRLVSWASTGTAAGAGVESFSRSQAEILVGVRIDFVSPSGLAPAPRNLLLRLSIAAVGAGYKVSNSEELK